MKNEICAIFDKRAQQYGPPMAFQTLGVAERSLQDAAAQADSNINRHPEDYQLYKIGEYNTDTAEMTTCPPLLICEAYQLVQTKG